MASNTIETQNGGIDKNNDACSSFAMSLLNTPITYVVINAVLELDILEIIKKLGPEGGRFSAKEIAAHLPAKNPEAATMLDRMLPLLASHAMLTCTVRSLPNGHVERIYGLAPVCRMFVKDSNGVSLAPLASITKQIIEAGSELKDSILEGGHPFERAYGMTQFAHLGNNPDVNTKFNTAMACHSTITMDKILEIYKGFEGISSLVDVGGGSGATLKLILSKYPNIKGINFDLPHVIDVAPPCFGVEHIGGDMFESIPRGDVIFLKWICHCWKDKECIRLLKNCYDAIPDHGKVIVCEYFLPENVGTDETTKSMFQFDALMMILPNGKERTQKEYQALAKAAGFQGFRVACSAFNTKVMELLK